MLSLFNHKNRLSRYSLRGHLILDFELPGFDREDITVEYRGGTLVWNAEKPRDRLGRIVGNKYTWSIEVKQQVRCKYIYNHER